MLQVVNDCIADFLSQWQARLTLSLSRDLNPSVLPIDVTEAQLDDIAGSKSQPSQQEQDRTIPLPYR
jgi:hypothetical protein